MPKSPGGTVTVDAGAILATSGTITAPTVDGVLSVTRNQTLVVDGPVSGGGGFLVQTGATLELAAGVAGPVAYNGPGTLTLDAPASFAGTVFGSAPATISC